MVRKIPRSKVGRIMEKLVEIEFLTRISDTYGTHVKICNYDKYQIPDNYKLDTDETLIGQQWDNSGTTVGTSKNDNNGKNVKNDIEVASDKPKQPTKPKKKSLSSLSEEEFFKFLEENPLYQGIDIRKLNEKLKVWCAGKGLKPTRQRLINWLNREDKQLSSGNRRLSSDWEP
jgi:hypothetical protein